MSQAFFMGNDRQVLFLLKLCNNNNNISTFCIALLTPTSSNGAGMSN